MTDSASRESKFDAGVKRRVEQSSPTSRVCSGSGGGSEDSSGLAGNAPLLLQRAALLKHTRHDLVAWSSNLQNELRRALAAKHFHDRSAAARPWNIGAAEALTSLSLGAGASFQAAVTTQTTRAALVRSASDGAGAATAAPPAQLAVPPHSAAAGPDSLERPARFADLPSQPAAAERLAEAADAGGGDGAPAGIPQSEAVSLPSPPASPSREDLRQSGEQPACAPNSTARAQTAVSATQSSSLPSCVIAGRGDSLRLDCQSLPPPAAAAALRPARREGMALRLLGRLYLGDMSVACNERYLCREGIDALVVVSSAPPPGAAALGAGASLGPAAPTVQCACRRQHSRARLLASLGRSDAASGSCYDEINKFIRLNRDARRGVLVCSSGADEQLAAAVAVQYAVRHGDLPLSDALRRLHKPQIISRTDLICLLQSVESRRALLLLSSAGGRRAAPRVGVVSDGDGGDDLE